MNYGVMNGPINKKNVKGILEADSLNRVIRPKIAYYAMQNVASVFDNTLQRIKNLATTHNIETPLKADEVKYNKGTDRSLAVYGYEHTQSKKQVFTIWLDEAIPTNTNLTKNVNFTILNGNFDKPVYVDILTGLVYEIPDNQWQKIGNKYVFNNLPVYDAPILIADKSLISLKK